MKRLKKGISTERLLRTKREENSFLVETSFNSAINLSIRKEIEFKFQKSKTNSEYVFPRVNSFKRTDQKPFYTKPSLENIGMLVRNHRQTRSSVQQLIENQSNDKTTSKNYTLPKCSKQLENFQTFAHSEGIFNRQLKTERNLESKSPKSTKNLEIFRKNRAGLKKIGVNDFSDKIRNPCLKKIKVLGSATSLQMKKIFFKVKNSLKY